EARVTNFFDQGMTQPEMVWYLRILNRDLKMGVSTGTVDNLFPGLIPSFDVMLCSTVEPQDLGSLFQTNHVWYVEPKIDGVRAVFMKLQPGDLWTVWSRNGKQFWNCGHIIDELNTVIKEKETVVIDGEFYGLSFQQTLSIVKTQSKIKDAEQ